MRVGTDLERYSEAARQISGYGSAYASVGTYGNCYRLGCPRAPDLKVLSTQCHLPNSRSKSPGSSNNDCPPTSPAEARIHAQARESDQLSKTEQREEPAHPQHLDKSTQPQISTYKTSFSRRRTIQHELPQSSSTSLSQPDKLSSPSLRNFTLLIVHILASTRRAYRKTSN